MAVFKIGDAEGSWFEMEGGGRVKLKALSYSDFRDIQKQATKYGPPEYPKLDGKHVRFQPEIVDSDLQLELTWDKSILGWEDLFDGNGNPIPCTREMKTALMLMKDDSFREFYNEKMKVLIDAEEDRMEAVEKNS